MTDILTQIAEASPEQVAEIKAIMGMAEQEQASVEPKAEKVKCKVCGFHKKARRVSGGVCKSCRTALDSGDEAYAEDAAVEVIGRMGKRGRNSVSVVIDGKRWKVTRLGSKHSERVAARYASKGKGYARKPKAHVSDIVSPKGLPTDSRIGGDRDQRTPDRLF